MFALRKRVRGTHFRCTLRQIFSAMGKFGLTEILVIAFVVLLLFGGRKIPELMRGLGQGVKEFKNASNGETGGSKGTSGNETKSE